MLKHGKRFPIRNGALVGHLKPIAHLVTKGIADLQEEIVLQPKACDVKGSDRFSVHNCAYARNAIRDLRLDGAAMGRRLCYLVYDGLAIRGRSSRPLTQNLDEFDRRGRMSKAPVKILPINETWKLGTPQRGKKKSVARGGKRKCVRKIGVRAPGGGRTS
jgi:hypothetical protein